MPSTVHADRRGGLTVVVGSLDALLFVLLLAMIFRYFSVWAAAVSAAVGLLASIGVFTFVTARAKDWDVPEFGLPLLVAVALIELAAVAGVLWATYYRDHRPVDVTAQVSVGNRVNLLPGGQAGVTVRTPGSGKRLVMVFRVDDTNPEASNCAPDVMLDVTLDTGGNPGVAQRAAPGAEVSVDLAPAAELVHLTVQVLNDDTNCAIDLSVAAATLIR